MHAASVELLGTVRPDGTLELDTKVTVPPGRVKVRVESVKPPASPEEGLVEFVQRLRREMVAAGHTFRTKEEIDAELDEIRNEWDEPDDDLHKGHDRRPGEAKPE